jgi:hypothetical protein
MAICGNAIYLVAKMKTGITVAGVAAGITGAPELLTNA